MGPRECVWTVYKPESKLTLYCRALPTFKHMSNDDAKRAQGRAAEQALLKQGKEYYALLQAESARQPAGFLAYLHNAFATFVPGLSPALFLLCCVAGLTSVLGPIASDFISSVAGDGVQSVWHQNIGDYFACYSGPGTMKSGTLEMVTEALHMRSSFNVYFGESMHALL